MNNDRKLLEQALNLLESEWPEGDEIAQPVIDAIREALAEPVKQEPIDESWCIEPKPINGLLVAEPELNLNCPSVQARLAAVWGYVKSEHLTWKPIETAPRHRRILVTGTEIGTCVASAGWDTETPDDIRWCVVNDIVVEPTHWMPIPYRNAAPVEDKAIRAEALEEAAKMCESKQSYNAMHANTEFAAAIRSLK